MSSHDQRLDLDRQQELLEAYCSAKGWRTQVIRDLGSGMNYRKKGLNQLLELIMKRQIRRLVISHKDRLLRFGAELVFSLCELQGIEIIIIHKGEQPSFEGAGQAGQRCAGNNYGVQRKAVWQSQQETQEDA